MKRSYECESRLQKHQIPSTKHQGSTKIQDPNTGVTNWLLELGISLEFEVWCLGFF